MLFFSITESIVLMALNFYYKDTLEKVMMQRAHQFLAFVCDRKNTVDRKGFNVNSLCAKDESNLTIGFLFK